MTFSGYSEAGLSFLTTLGGKDKTWFDANRSTYDSEVVGPTKDFVVALGEVLTETISPTLVAQPKTNGSMAPINNDIRFSKDKTPYKDHLLLKFWDGADKKSAPTLWVRISEDSVGFATGAPFGSLDRWRQLIDDDTSGAELASAIAALGEGRDLEVAGEGLKKVPKPYDADHPRADLLRHKAFQARWPEKTPAGIHSAAFVDWCAKRLARCGPIHHWFLQHRP